MLKINHPNLSGYELERQAKEAIRRILSSIPGVCLELVDEPPHAPWDFVVRLITSHGVKTLICEAKSRAWPNELHAVAHRLKAGLQNLESEQAIPVFISPYVSKQAAETCIDLGLSWADLVGNCELRIDGAYIKVQGEPNPFRKGRGTASLYTPKSSNVLHALLQDGTRSWTTEDLAQAAHVSLGQVASVKKLLEANNWIRASYGKTELVEPAKLLKDWSQHFQPKRKTLRFFTLESPHECESRVANTLPEYAFTEFSAAERYAPYTRHQRVAFYVSRWEDDWGRSLGLKQADGASNVTVYEQSEPFLFAETLAGVRCVSPIQTYLDLKALAGRGQDAASRLLETVIWPRWK